MIYQLIHCFVCLVLDTLAAAGIAVHEKDLEIALLRQQLRILERRLDAKPRLWRPEKLMLVALAGRLERSTQQLRDWLRQCLLLVKPDTLLQWHRDVVRRKWTFQAPKVGGRPRIDAELEGLIVRLVRENPLWGVLNASVPVSWIELSQCGLMGRLGRPGESGIRAPCHSWQHSVWAGQR